MCSSSEVKVRNQIGLVIQRPLPLMLHWFEFQCKLPSENSHVVMLHMCLHVMQEGLVADFRGRRQAPIFYFFFVIDRKHERHFHRDPGPWLPFLSLSPRAVRARAEAANFPASEGQVREGREGG